MIQWGIAMQRGIWLQSGVKACRGGDSFSAQQKILRICKIVETLTNLYFFVVKWVECINLPVFCAGVGTVHAGIPITGSVI